MIAVLNLQTAVELKLPVFRAFAKQLVSAVPEASGHVFSVALISDERMKELNSLFRGKDAATDVLSFPNRPDDFEPIKNDLGDIVISAEQAQRQAAANGLTLENEIKQLMLHGLLHLCGYDHETDSGEMNARELQLRENLNI
jgi:probable rRNA maturation factor